MLPRQTMRICSWWRRRCRFCHQTDKIRKSVVPSVILAIANVVIIIIFGCVEMQVSVYCMTINAKHDDTCDRHCHNSPLSLINQHVESINNVLYCMLLPMNKGKLNKLNKEFAHTLGGAATAAATTQWQSYDCHDHLQAQVGPFHDVEHGWGYHWTCEEASIWHNGSDGK
jgi:hypothetical protein